MNIGRRLLILIVIVVILVTPLIAMQFSSEVNWSFVDFVVAGFLLLIAGFLFDVTFRKVRNKKWRYLVGIGIILLFLMIWAELAVGILGTPFSGD